MMQSLTRSKLAATQHKTGFAIDKMAGFAYQKWSKLIFGI
jgi:hypothetical protein